MNKTKPFPSDFKPKGSTPEKIAEYHLGSMGRMVGGSKSIYRHDNPDHMVIFNANILTKQNGKIWHGDLDITKDLSVLREMAEDLERSVFVFYEMDARFGKEDDVDFSLRALEIHEDGRVLLRDSEYDYFKDGTIYTKTDDEIMASAPKKEAVIEKEEEFTSIELPDLKSIKVTKKSDPLSQFQKYFIDKYGKDKAKEIYDKLYVTRSYYEQLEKLAEKHTKKLYPGMHPVKIEQSVAWYMLDMSPKSFESDQTWEKPNTGYLKS